MSGLTDAQAKRKLNAIWEEMSEIKKLLEKQDASSISDELRALGDKFALIVKENNLEPINIKELAKELEAILPQHEAPDLSQIEAKISNLPELSKLIEGHTEKTVQEAVSEALKTLEPIIQRSEKTGKIKIQMPTSMEIHGKALVKIEGNAPDNPLFVQLSDGERVVDLSKLFNVSVGVQQAGGAPDSSGASSGTSAAAKYVYQTKSLTSTYKYFYFEDADLNWYIRRRTLATGVDDFTKGTGGYTSVFVDSTSNPNIPGTPTWGSWGVIF